jgi:hypothetical protein
MKEHWELTVKHDAKSNIMTLGLMVNRLTDGVLENHNAGQTNLGPLDDPLHIDRVQNVEEH